MTIRGLLAGALSLFLVGGAAAQLKTPPETRNAALRYWLAFAEIKDPPAEPELQEELEKTLAGKLPWDETKLGRLLDENAAALDIFRRATHLPECDWGLDYSQGAQASIAYVPRARVIARLNTLQGIREAAKGNTQAAVDDWLAGVRFSEHLSRGGSLIFSLIGAKMMIENFDLLSAAARKKALSDGQKKEIQETLASLPHDGIDMATAWQIESAGGEHFLITLQKSRNAAEEYRKVTAQPVAKECIPPSNQQVKAFDEYVEAIGKALELDPETSKKQIEALESKRQNLCPSIQWMIPHTQNVDQARADVLAAKKKLQAAISIK